MKPYKVLCHSMLLFAFFDDGNENATKQKI